MDKNWQECFYQMQMYQRGIGEIISWLRIASLCADEMAKCVKEMGEIWNNFWKTYPIRNPK